MEERKEPRRSDAHSLISSQKKKGEKKNRPVEKKGKKGEREDGLGAPLLPLSIKKKKRGGGEGRKDRTYLQLVEVGGERGKKKDSFEKDLFHLSGA